MAEYWDGERLFAELQRLLDSDENIAELGLIVSVEEILESIGKTDASMDTSKPIPFVLLEHNLGVSFWCIPQLCKYTWSRMNQLIRIKEGSDEFNAAILEMIQVTRTILLVNSDHYTAWNLRKKLLLSGHILPAVELQLSKLIFSKHPKSGESWAHRRWVLEKFPANLNLKDEIKVSERTAELYPKNYYSWTHRRWVMEQMTDEEKLGELNTARVWVRTHLSQNCAFRYLGMIIERLHHGEVKAYWTLESEFKFVKDLIKLYPGHESLWMHRRFLWKLYASTYIQFKDGEFLEKTQAESDSCQSNIDEKEVENFAAQRTLAYGYRLWIWILAREKTKDPVCESNIKNACAELQSYSTLQQNVWSSLPKSILSKIN